MDIDLDNSALAYTVDMVETRARNLRCKTLKSTLKGNSAFDAASLETRSRWLRALLPSVRALPKFTWHDSFRPCFTDVRAPCLQMLSVFLDDSQVGGGAFTRKALEAAPALVGIQIESHNTAPTLLGASALQSVTAALQRGALQNWQDLWTLWRILAASRCDFGR